MRPSLQAAALVRPKSPVALIARRPPTWVDEKSSIVEAAQAMRAANISSALVGPEAMVSSTGIVTEPDLVRALSAGLGPDDPISRVAVQHPVVVASDVRVPAPPQRVRQGDETGSAKREALTTIFGRLQPGLPSKATDLQVSRTWQGLSRDGQEGGFRRPGLKGARSKFPGDLHSCYWPGASSAFGTARAGTPAGNYSIARRFAGRSQAGQKQPSPDTRAASWLVPFTPGLCLGVVPCGSWERWVKVGRP